MLYEDNFQSKNIPASPDARSVDYATVHWTCTVVVTPQTH